MSGLDKPEDAYGKSLYEVFCNAVNSYYDKTAIVGEKEDITFRDLRAEAESLCASIGSLIEHNVVGLQIESPIDFMVAYFAVAKSSAHLVLLDPRATGKERDDLLADLAIDQLLVLSDESTSSAEGLKHITAIGRIYLLQRVASDLQRNASARYLPGDFVVHTTSGSTGRPKGIALSADNVIARIKSWRNSTGLTANDTVLCMLTLSHCHGIEILMLPALLTGCTVVSPSPSAISARRIVKLIGRHRVNLISTLPWFYSVMTESIPPEKCDLSSLRMTISASARLEPQLAKEFKAKFGIQLRQAYGLSEIGAICLDRDAQDETLVGTPLDGVEVRLVSDTGNLHEGELISRGPGLARGYINAPAAEAEMFRDGWLWSKDIVRSEPDGYRIVGRRSRFINVGGNNVAPSMIEDALLSGPGVREVAVRGLPDPIKGEKIAAYVVWEGESQLESLQAHCRERLASYCQPTEWFTLDALPRNGIGKIMLESLG